MPTVAANVLRYSPDDETPTADEAEIEASIARSMRGILESTYDDYGHAVRSVHAKSHALLEGELTVFGDLPGSLAQGVFARGATFPVVLRLSTNPGDVLDDSISAPRGFAIKIVGVEGERLPGSEGDATQDFVMVNSPAFSAATTRDFVVSLKALAATTDTGQGWKKALSAVLRGAEKGVEALGGKSPKLVTLGGQALTHPLGDTYYSVTPFRYGEHVAKLAIAPVSPDLAVLTGRPVDVSGKPNGLREAVIEHFRTRGGEWELRVQLRTDAEKMPIEDASVEWPESSSPFVAVGRITVPPQPAWSEQRALQGDDGLAFSPWHGIVAHQPLGSINRARRKPYAMAAAFRAEHNRCPIHEPRGRIGLSDAPAGVYGEAPGREGRRPGTPDARPGYRGQPLNAGAREVVGGAAGGLVAGVLTSVLLAGQQAVTRSPSDLIRLQRRTLDRLGRPHRSENASPAAFEEAIGHAGHLALSVISGAAFGAIKPKGASPLVAGAAFGLGFYALAYGLIGPLAGVTPRLWRDTRGSIAQHGAMHLLFGVATALVAQRVARRL